MNIIVFAVNQKLMIMETEKADLEVRQRREKFDYDEYMMLKEAQQQTAILNHDLKAHIDTLSTLIGADNEAAQEYIKSMSVGISKSQFIEYSDNKILNVLLSKKKEECQNKGIQFFIDPIQARLQFLGDMDTVTIFSNLINNAMESCIKSKDKKIYLNIHTANENFAVIKMENTSDTKPIVINGRLKTHKDNSKLHGIGMNSIMRALNAYNGSLTWEYNEPEKVFSTKIIIKNLTV
ncbi:MAG: ATP-binding protein [bacterium]|nr:ATP-binding protein [bacterium]